MDRHASGRHSRRRRHRHAAGLYHRLPECAVVHRHARRSAGLARRHLVRHQRSHRGAYGFHLPPDGRRHQRLDRRDMELDRRYRCLRRHRRGNPQFPSPAPPFRLSTAAGLGGIFPGGTRLLRRHRFCGCRQQLSLADQHRPQLCRCQWHHLAGRRSVHSARHRHSGADSARRWCSDDLHRHAAALRTLCIRHRR
ncbi:hypothetical protein D3C80_1458180 [compost metagenome]